MGKRTYFYFVSGFILLIGLLSILIKGLEFGIDFKGGSEVAIQFEKPVDISYLRNVVNKIGLGEVEVKTFGGSTGVLIRTTLQEIPKNVLPVVKSRIEKIINDNFPNIEKQELESTSNSITYSFSNDSTAEAVANKLFENGFTSTKTSEEISKTGIVVKLGISDWIKDNLSEKIKENKFNVLKEDKVGPKVGGELKRDAVIAIILSLIVIMIYLAFRFKFAFALGAVIALFHDVLITLGVFVVLYGVIPGFNLEISISVVAAFLTLVGYSINDTVIVFDRVREQIKIHKTIPLEENMNLAINKTLSRTLITVFTTLLTIIVLLIFGGDVLRGFAFALLIGMITGTYSSVFVASAFVLEYANRTNSKVTF
ncbi:protein translocase subunit SecF [Stygiobacter electus]|uniref:Protein-export membrane protein SecF n=1 Tax=Stygiobacter electus TaxID=3032292 RepID=A0AAE3TCS2_9BACT|nr:protein translocase subunit SecF [Stygiobacter electus]MDF1610742.1 protein translocase subunit SecF [Stygiobacter electus]